MRSMRFLLGSFRYWPGGRIAVLPKSHSQAIPKFYSSSFLTHTEVHHPFPWCRQGILHAERRTSLFMATKGLGSFGFSPHGTSLALNRAVTKGSGFFDFSPLLSGLGIQTGRLRWRIAKRTHGVRSAVGARFRAISRSLDASLVSGHRTSRSSASPVRLR